MMIIRGALLGAGLMLCAAPALAQSNAPSPGGATVPYAVQSCLNSSGQAVPVSNGTCQNPAQVTSTITGTPAVDTELPAAAAAADGATNPTAPFVLGANELFNGTTWDRQRGVNNAQSSGLGTAAVAIAPTSVAGGAIAYTSSGALAANTVIKASAGNLYSFEVSADSTLSAAPWWIMIYDATTAPVDGAVTPAKCYALPAGSTSYSALFNVPLRLATGIVIGVSTNGCFTKAASTHAFISGDAQ